MDKKTGKITLKTLLECMQQISDNLDNIASSAAVCSVSFENPDAFERLTPESVAGAFAAIYDNAKKLQEDVDNVACVMKHGVSEAEPTEDN